MRKNLVPTLVAVTLMGGCLGSASKSGQNAGSASTSDTTSSSTSTSSSSTSTPSDPATDNLNARTINYGEAARTAAVKLLGDLPTADELATVKDSASYNALIEKWLADPRLARQLMSYFQDVFKVGGPSPGKNQPTHDTAATFAAELAVSGADFRTLFTATTNTCPSLDPSSGTFTDASCTQTNGLPTSGVLTDPGIMSAMFSNMSMRRVRWLQETFLCSAFPAEFSPKGGTPMGSGLFTSPWPFDSVAGGSSALVNFQDTSAIICANCHTTINHIAPLFANFDANGNYQTSIQVVVPVNGNPTAKISDWLADGEVTSYRYEKPAATITDLGNLMAADPATAQCQVSRLWNWAMDKGDIVNDAASVPTTTTTTVLSAYTKSYSFKDAIRATFEHDDFVKF